MSGPFEPTGPAELPVSGDAGEHPPPPPGPVPAQPVRTRFAEPGARSVGPGPVPPTPAAAEPIPHEPVPPEPEPVPPEPVVEPTTVEPAARSGRGLLVTLAVLVPLLALLVAYLGYLSVATRGAAPIETSRRDALAASRSAARQIFSYDYRHLAKDFAAGKALTTGKFTSDYDASTKKVVTDFATRYKAVMLADVSNAGVESSRRDRVVALVFLNQQSTSTQQTTPKITQSRVRMTMVLRKGHWLVEGATVI